MNFYQHHIGDFRGGTINMSRLERWLYRDMIEVYYDKEAPLPADIAKVCKMIGARTEDEREAVQNVLEIKFELQEDGWHHERCDAAVAAYKAAASEDLERQANEAERQRRYRARRAEIFRILREEYDEVPEYDLDMKSLRRLLEQLQKQRDMAGTFTGNTEEIHSTSQPVTRDTQVRSSDATAVTINQEPLTINQNKNLMSGKIPDAPLDSDQPVDNFFTPEATEAPETAANEPEKKPGGKKFHGTEEDYTAATWMFEQVKKLNQAAKQPSWDRWANEVRLMREIDGRTHSEICAMFRWANKDTFWCYNILSPDKLREKWDRLAAERAKPSPAAVLPMNGATRPSINPPVGHDYKNDPVLAGLKKAM